MSALLQLDQVGVALGKVIVVEGVSLAVERGEVIALLGSNGAGKTTLLRASLGLAQIHTGAVRLGGDNPRQLSARDRAQRAACLPQRPQAVWPVSVEAIVALGRFCYGAAPERLSPVDQAAVDAALAACSLLDLRARRIDEISGGERARAHLARVLAQQAPLLLLDEPDAGLDPAQALEVSDILRRHGAGGGGIVFSTHDIALAARTASRVVLLRAGRVIAEGAPEAALTPEALERAYGRKGRLELIGRVHVAIFE
jgi:iron complex transport system ATP-binding protein